MKVFCNVHGKPAVIVGYGPGRKGKIRAIVITEGVMKDVALKEIVLDDDEKELPNNVEVFRQRKNA